MIKKFKGFGIPKSLNVRLLLFLILCWLVPLGVFFVFTTGFYREGIINKTEILMQEELETIASVSAIRIEEAVSLCQKPSYEKNWETSWNYLKKGDLNKTDFLRTINSSMKGKFYLDERFNNYAFYMYGSTKPDCYGSRVGISYNQYVDEAQQGVQKVMDLDSSYTYVRIIEGNLYIIRNLYTTSGYERFGTLVVELNPSKVFAELPAGLKGNLMVLIENSDSYLSFYPDKMEQVEGSLLNKIKSQYDGIENGRLVRIKEGPYNGYLYQKTCEYYRVGIVTTIRHSELYESLYLMYKVILIMLILFLPLILFGVFFLRQQIQNPISRLVKAANKLEDGEMGVHIEGTRMPNREFDVLMESFNNMSSQIKYLFDTVYNEKLARKDAQIQALQAQINPHFLNNTLEMMNWQARMSGDIVVSKMIESLGTVMNYLMNRADTHMIHLSEELRCTDAYLYIMTMRFGARLKIEKEIDADLMGIDVPPLIFQPIVENAIVHGVEKVKSGSIQLKVYHDATCLFLQVINTGKPLSEADLKRMRDILSGEADLSPKQKGHYTSIGIRNVNKRIRLVYGDEYGLTIESAEDDRTVSTITIPYRPGRSS